MNQAIEQKFYLGQIVYFIESRAGQLCIESMQIFKAKLTKRLEQIMYSGTMIIGGDTDEGHYWENRLYPSYEASLNEIERQLNELRIKRGVS